MNTVQRILKNASVLLAALVINLLGYSRITVHVVLKAFSTVSYILTLCGMLFAKNQGFIGFAFIYVIAFLIDVLYFLGICLWKFVFPKFSIVLCYFRIGTFMLSMMKGDSDVRI